MFLHFQFLKHDLMGFKFYISIEYCLWYSQVSDCVCIENCVSDFTLEGKSVNLITEAPVLSAFFYGSYNWRTRKEEEDLPALKAMIQTFGSLFVVL